ncbi:MULTISPECIES: DUF2625 family protein [Streptomyces]|uniref:DUF2625 family protein n=1 Tax=Streptomyces TaxID=1883 RepID=UPI00099E9478|nr:MULTISPECIES: DUF2625 family protein [Streptomyces]MDI5903962.1 DUF2625 family protein [Streptomyces sp. 12257]
MPAVGPGIPEARFNRVEVRPGDPEIGRASLLQLQVSARSISGGIVLNCGGLLVDSGWLRIFGSPSGAHVEGLPGLAEINATPATFDPAWSAGAGLVIAHDVLGGVFTLNRDSCPRTHESARRPMGILEQQFGLTLPKEAILAGTLPAAIIKT